MVSLKTSLALFAVLAFAGAGAPVLADEEVVTVTGTRGACEGISASDASKLARKAEKEGSYREASECFLAAGEYTRAHRASVKAAGEAAEHAKHRTSVAADRARSQMARVRDAFR